MAEECGSGAASSEQLRSAEPASPLSSFAPDEALHLRASDPAQATYHGSRPRTPEHQMDEPHDAHTPLVSPTLPSPMSFYHLGVSPSPLSPLRRQLSYGLNMNFSLGSARNGASDVDREMSSDGDLTEDQDRKDVLMDRLNDLVQRLSNGESVQEASIDSLHAKVDEMEQVLAGDGSAARSRRPRRPPLPGRGSMLGSPTRSAEQEQRDLRLLNTPDWLVPRLSEMATPGTAADVPISVPAAVDRAGNGTKISAEVAGRLAIGAQKLCAELASALSSLQARREESEHLSEILIDRAEGAAKRILELEEDVARLEDELGGNESELKHLRLRLRALEVMCYEYVPADADPELLQSIENWKSDWTTLKNKMAAKTRQRNPHAEANSALSTPNASTLL